VQTEKMKTKDDDILNTLLDARVHEPQDFTALPHANINQDDKGSSETLLEALASTQQQSQSLGVVAPRPPV